MSPEELELINFVLHIPPDVNPYLAVAERMKASIDLPPQPPWTTIPQRFAMLFFMLLLVQAILVIDARTKVKAFKPLTFGSLGLVRLDISSMTAVAYGLYAPLVISDLILEEFMKAGLRDMSGEIMLFGCKFLVILYVEWGTCLVQMRMLEISCAYSLTFTFIKGFMWACICQCAVLIYESPMAPQENIGRGMSPIVRRGLNALFVSIILVPMSLVVYCYGTVNNEYEKAKSILYGVIQKLYTEANGFKAETYSRINLLMLLIPARDMAPHIDQIARFTRYGIVVYLVTLCFFVLTYIPLLSFSLSRLYARSVSQKDLRLAAGPEGNLNNKFAAASQKIRLQRRRLVLLALATLATTALHVPVLIAQLSFKGNRFMIDQKWILLTRVGLHLPFSILGNIILGIIHIHARQQVADMQAKGPQSNLNLSSSGGGSHSERSYLTSTFKTKIEIEPPNQQVELDVYSHKSDQKNVKKSEDSSTYKTEILTV
ncbi:hypothetical protein CROQUDRAFT_107488 [Cronartium quercuum f. sp. fusiforme G11]|uniref:Uncharacterized protein n=1 Tax=Cronartium quercuum f. sp. fusiforme G11 TaxID=708437 RepID=A0A9P6TBR7_9BASI|nr:hypothetical protein CROQUDRAFT_107488 [Cronartium quercuum f. sp. fusiforme G11]